MEEFIILKVSWPWP